MKQGFLKDSESRAFSETMIEVTKPIDSTAQRILEAAEKIFGEQGYRCATVRDILEAAGVRNIAAVNYYFGSKENLYVTVVKYAHRHCINKVPMPDWPPGTPARQRLTDFVRVMCRRVFLSDRPWSHQLMLRELVEPTRACSEVVEEYVRPLTNTLSAILSELLPHLPVGEHYRYTCSIMGQILIYRTHREFLRHLLGQETFDHIDVEKLAMHVTEFSLAGLRHASDHGSDVSA
jgi:AcrR family transcriptional regulator